jgi:hypothetical protein
MQSCYIIDDTVDLVIPTDTMPTALQQSHDRNQPGYFENLAKEKYA